MQSLDEDRILRHFVNAVQSAIRTNFYQTGKDGQPKPLIAIKFESGKITDMPLPRPLYEIFVYSPRVEGVHMRFGKVARGGIRWSDRPQDFRTEVLGLVKAQQVKNAVIVPVGAKGGFVPKLMPKAATREQIQAEGIATYKLFISTLLDITDNIGADGKIIPPDCVVRHEGDDPYLVVAADKGTATFSDIANEISIAARLLAGRCFRLRRLGRLRPQGHGHHRARRLGGGEAAFPRDGRRYRRRRRFQRVGVGDMSGDVFGNGMLREDTTKLVAAFDHRDIFIDPDPDPKASFAERKRLFASAALELAGLRQEADLERRRRLSAHSSRKSSCRRRRRNCSAFAEAVTPQALMKAILKAPVDLLFFGGIGTYVRAATEADEAAGDRANDAIRITGGDLRCKVIGEGANLGMTQRGRIEAALNGVRLNTDAIDNSAGVNTSDVEVNIKIALSPLVRSGALKIEARNKLLDRDDRRGRAAGVAQQLPADAGAVLGAAARAGGSRLPAAPDADAGNARPARPRGGIPARRDRARRPAQAQPGADAAGARRAAGLCQAHALFRIARIRPCRTILIWGASSAVISPRKCRSATTRRCTRTACGARSSPRS